MLVCKSLTLFHLRSLRRRISVLSTVLYLRDPHVNSTFWSKCASSRARSCTLPTATIEVILELETRREQYGYINFLGRTCGTLPLGHEEIRMEVRAGCLRKVSFFTLSTFATETDSSLSLSSPVLFSPPPYLWRGHSGWLQVTCYNGYVSWLV